MALTKVSTGVVDLSDDTGALAISKGTTGQRPLTSTLGMLRANTTDHTMEVYTSANWQVLGEGTDLPPLVVDYLVIAGGGGGGAAAYNSHATVGGGGAGGYRNSYNSESSGGGNASETALTLLTNISYNLVVGTGGDGAAYQSQASNPGTYSGFKNIVSIGGGGGDSRNRFSTNGNGGSGGGGCYGRSGGAATANQGFNGGGTGANILFSVGGGGGAGSIGTVGDSRSSSSLSCGGNGLASQITGVGVVRAEGGGGSRDTANTSFPALKQGSGGYGGNDVYNGATLRRGSDGIIILRYPTGYSIAVTGSLFRSTAIVGTDNVTTFTSGTGTITFS